ncbi:hypothetical protein EGR_07585 [Echinococcus granulosus]|uniref:Uncharacterized protein n=1 Tax=Echinococcus granulosus TaxID=6210 RepID=W6UVV3_ECHGR|nr:hypothetical protein EGR_07585 [Echinococcus granulosus]EUB57574.1 hypothetical protein EGR_07585 [Echinococcus granulosus]
MLMKSRFQPTMCAGFRVSPAIQYPRSGSYKLSGVGVCVCLRFMEKQREERERGEKGVRATSKHRVRDPNSCRSVAWRQPNLPTRFPLPPRIALHRTDICPFAYKIPGMTEKMLLRLKRKEVGLKVPFDSSSERITKTAAKRCEGPGPHDYYNKLQPECRREIPEKISISRRNSDSRAPIERERCPPPTTYDVTMAFKALKDHRSFRASRRDKSNEAFLCSSPRFTKYTEGVAGFIANPGPGAYCVKRDPQPKCGTFRRTEERFRDVDNGQPGPADYKVAVQLPDTSIKYRLITLTTYLRLTWFRPPSSDANLYRLRDSRQRADSLPLLCHCHPHRVLGRL